ncbi:hypothetical protein CH370_17440 [Leptospira kmetyi]|nr:hypothetical protein CH370_17440 [Leptospira kmetyi]
MIGAAPTLIGRWWRASWENFGQIRFIRKSIYSQSKNDDLVGTFSEIRKPIYNFAEDFFDLKRANDLVVARAKAATLPNRFSSI